MIINISLKPRPGRWDVNCPVPIVVKPSNDPKINATEKEILNLFKDLKDKEIQITENNGPIPFAERVTNILTKHGFNAKVYTQYKNSLYYNKKDNFFINPKKPYYFFINEFEKIIKDFVSFYKKQELTIEEPDSGVCGHYYRGKMLWTQIQNNYDLNSSKNKTFMEYYFELFKVISVYMEEVLQKKNLKDRITLRIVDYKNEKDINKTLGSHIDMSYTTAVLYEDHPGLHVKNFLDDKLTLNNSKLINVSRYLSSGMSVLFPGNSYCEENKTWVPACWHGVEMLPEIKRRVSFLVRVENE